jgi:hypothetical protein
MAQGHGERENPLADRDAWKNPVNERSRILVAEKKHESEGKEDSAPPNSEVELAQVLS